MANNREARDSAVQSVDRALSILQVLARRGSARVTDIALELSVHKSTVSRLLGTLEARGMVDQATSRGSYTLGGGVLQLAAGATRRHDVSLASRPVCTELAAATGETVVVTILDGDAVLSIEQVLGSSSVTSVNWIGKRSPLHATASGKLLLAQLPPDERRRRLPARLEALTDRTITDLRALEADLALAVERGYAMTLEEQEIGLTALATPVRDLQGEVIAALTVSGPNYRLTPEALPHLVAQMEAAAARISERNGYPKRG